MNRKMSLLMVAGAVASLSLLGVAVTASAAKKADKARSCYPANEYVANPGAASGSYNGEGDTTYEIEVAGFPSTEPHGHALIHMWFQVSGNNGPVDSQAPGTLSGFLHAEFRIGGSPGTFNSTCIAEGQSDAGEGPQGVEAEWEGIVTGFPGSPGPTPAVATVSGSNVNGRPSFHFNVELGTTCNENSGEFDSSSVEGGTISGRFNSSNNVAGRYGFPSGKTPAACDA